MLPSSHCALAIGNQVVITYRALFSFGGTLSSPSPAEVSNLGGAIENALVTSAHG
jgi:hypothetical protein